MNRRDGWANSARYWQVVPRRSYVMLLTGIFCLFAALGFVIGFFSDVWWYVRWSILVALVCGVCAIGYAHGGFRRVIWLIVIMFPLQVAVMNYIGWLMGRHAHELTSADLTQAAIRSRLKAEGTMMMFMIIGGYVLIVSFVRSEGRRVFGPITEVRLAHDVHQRLVPEVAQT